MKIPLKMGIFVHVLAFLPILSTLSLLASCQPTSSNHIDREAILGLKSVITNDPSGALSSWGNGSSPCTWTGVLCNQGGRVSKLDLGGLNLAGRISPHIGNLSALQSLYLQNNQLVGNIPNQIGKLSQLRTLNLSGNQITGAIPPTLTNCTSLEMVDLSSNTISGAIPSSIDILQKLQVLKMGKNKLHGSIPSSIGNLSLLRTLDVNTNNLTGRIYEELGRLKNIQYLQLSLNNLSGIVPQPLYNLSTLEFLAFASNGLYGEIPIDIGFRLPNLRVFHICWNKFSGQIPPSLHNVTNIESIRMSNNLLSGSVPPGLSELHNLVMYNIGFNRISDTTSILIGLTNSTKLEFIGLDENLIEGSLPDSIGNLSNSLTKMYLGGNRIIGQIPPSIGNLTSLTLLNMTHNLLSGSIPTEIGQLKQLTRLGLSWNKLSGSIPVEIGNLTVLTTLEISHNELVGRIPAELGRLQQVILLDISSNKLQGDIPTSLFALRSLSSVLNLSHNSLTGAVSDTIGQLQNIIAIDLSDNFFNSRIPLSIGLCQSLQTLSLRRNDLSGVIPDTIANLQGLQSLDLSSNQLSGSIPESLAKLEYLQLLNLSQNDLSGLVSNTGVFDKHSVIYLDGNPKLCYSSMACFHSRHSNNRQKLYIAIAVAIASLAAISIFIWSIKVFLSRRHLGTAKTVPMVSLIKTNHPLISYEELYRATNSFDQSNLIGTGSFSSVYKAMLHDGTPVAIKVLDLDKTGAPKSWVTECEALRNLRHRNLIKLVTICASVDFSGNEFRALVYELLCNGSLEDWIHKRRQHDDGTGLHAEEVLNIAIDAASALDYMHNNCGGQAVHCDIKPSNVLLDVDMTAKVGDFGLARLLAPVQPEQQSISSVHVLKGSIGYIPPEYGYGNKPSTRGDTYSYGVMLLEMITGKSPVEHRFGGDMNISRWVRDSFPHRAHEVIDKDLTSTIEGVQISNTEQVLRDCLLVPMVDVALSCVAESPDERISMHDCLHRLKRIKDSFVAQLQRCRGPNRR
ncbi:hypothetical protein ACP4OV_001426 [Aristida adscensionis]